MPSLNSLLKLKRPSLSSWPTVGIFGVLLALVALIYGGAMGNLATTCTLRVEATQVSVVSAPTPGSTRLRTVRMGEQLRVDPDRPQQDGYWKLDRENAWVQGGDSVAATSGSHC